MQVTVDAVERELRDRLGERALGHSLRVADSAASLAVTYGVDAEKARLSGLLHDWDRELSGDELIQAALDAGLEVTETDRAVPYLLHARTAAIQLARRFPGLSADVIAAVERHTVGSADMTPLDKVVFLADMLEPGRDWPGVEEMRRGVGVLNLDELFVSAYRRSVSHLIELGKHIHPSTVEVWNALVAEDRR